MSDKGEEKKFVAEGCEPKVPAEELGLPVDEHIEEEVSASGAKVRARGVYLLPNLITTGALFSGFYAIIAGMNGSFEAAAIAIFAAMILDGLDGRVARLTDTQSAFGVQYDSLSDMVSFGLAPALVVFGWALDLLGKFGWAAAFLYAACAALRLARFNTQVDTVDKGVFIGLASPTAAAIVASMVWAGHNTDVGIGLAVVAAGVTVISGLLMVSNFRYTSFKKVDFKGRVPFVMMLAVILIFSLVTIDPPRVLLTIAVIYTASGPGLWLWRWSRSKSAMGGATGKEEGRQAEDNQE
ncbi:CDP-diacylglycerol--serine O-phosphatidyltransferase [Microbulbifer thermotolerans]|uniref:CDP-diacylglycerol--serine O-phosphatidyltransferase n=1 Tax=Microbulbifer thermotolerans TaxID=252514 RepID=UPI00224A7620|nr:CDP-diacylglycerol--serine O-phosphatidyltransferase [Microbulbifer thermotolerans]MCX2780266.1 CDP-diacylglycerol--serine O-phosphatidyltransferase [Microbulbifer thermotolerans]MCX2805780.1 CDP-diacylglycerol--serine O-phosphatidyltransferase [Microbulbifer thermotolerans]MCX2835598.1 CDP-diacylglycerol--serine O-phosphatidyltransferase [Microbulbifer thermotolerans]WKT61151.1 CDP-diacylglycerol--serine O-phosphatidyltransferase [Microbulbifer thermotolerans]